MRTWWATLIGGIAAVGCSSDDAGSGARDTGLATASDAVASDVPDTVEADDEVSVPDDTTSDDTSDDDAPTNGFAYLVVDPTELDFGTRAVDEIVTLDLVLENAGELPLTLTRIYLAGSSESFGSNVAQALVTPHAKKTVKVTFYALAEGVFDDVLRFESNAVNGARLDVPLHGVVSASLCEDADHDGHGVHCSAGADCNDSDPSVFVGAPETCDGVDQDCDGLHDEDFVGLGTACEAGIGGCSAEGVRICGEDHASLRCSVNPVTGGSELCNDRDDDCDGATDEDFPSRNKLCAVGLGACRVVDKFVCSADGTSLVCNVTPATPSEEICGDHVDNDCDGITDEGELELCGDTVDNDCDGETDESGSAWGDTFFARNWYAESVAIYPAQADGTFAPEVVLDLPNDARWGVVAVGDFDADRWLDLVVTETSTDGRTICSLPADCPTNFGCKGGVCRRLCATANGGAAACSAGETCIDFSPYANDATDTWCQPPTPVRLAKSSCDGEGGIAVTPLFELAPGETLGPVIDADGNGHLDFVGISHWSLKTGFVWLSDGAGHYEKLSPAFDWAALFGPGAQGWWVWGLVKTSKDFDGDGIVDVLGRSYSSGGDPPTDLWLMKGHGDGTFAAAANLGVTFPRPANLVTGNDFDGDGDQDLVGGLDDDGDPGGAFMLLNRSAPTQSVWTASYPIFDVAPTYESGGEMPGTGYGTSFDFTRDHRPDVLAGWIPEECGSYVWGCPQITNASHVCYGGNCRKIGLLRNKTSDACSAGTSCVDGKCVPGCTPDCTNKQCGSDGCGGVCGVQAGGCAGGQVCARGQCVVDCVPDCDGRACGDDGCGGQCGDCAVGQSCVTQSAAAGGGTACVSGCVPNCAGRRCGDDGCGGQCAVFGDPEVIAFDSNPYINVEAPTNVPPTRPVLAVQPATPEAGAALTCAIVVASYDLDAISYHYRWFRTIAGSTQAALDVGDRADVPAGLTSAGEQWHCRAWATDGNERSIAADANPVLVMP